MWPPSNPRARPWETLGEQASLGHGMRAIVLHHRGVVISFGVFLRGECVEIHFFVLDVA